MKQNNIKKLAISSLFVALGVVLSPISIPVGFAKAYPIQHLINVLSALILGPFYGVLTAFSISLIRNILATGTLLAFPGSMIGVFLASILVKNYKGSYSGKIFMAWIGEVFGTGIIGAIVSYPVAKYLIGKNAAVFTFVIPFLTSTVVGSIMGIMIFHAIYKATGNRLALID